MRIRVFTRIELYLGGTEPREEKSSQVTWSETRSFFVVDWYASMNNGKVALFDYELGINVKKK